MNSLHTPVSECAAAILECLKEHVQINVALENVCNILNQHFFLNLAFYIIMSGFLELLNYLVWFSL